jgi:hypothetical protein
MDSQAPPHCQPGHHCNCTLHSWEWFNIDQLEEILIKWVREEAPLVTLGPVFFGRVTWVNEGVIDGSMPRSVTKEVCKLSVNSLGIQCLSVCCPLGMWMGSVGEHSVPHPGPLPCPSPPPTFPLLFILAALPEAFPPLVPGLEQTVSWAGRR